MAGPCPPLVLVLASVNSVARLCGWALSSSCPPLVNSVNSVAGLCGWALSSSGPPFVRAPELCQLCGWALWLARPSTLLWLGLVLLLSSSWPHPPVVLLLAAPLNSCQLCGGDAVAGLCAKALSSSCPPLARVCQLFCWAVWLGSVSRPCPPLVLVLAAPLMCLPLGRAPELCQNCGWALSSSCPPLGRAPELCQLCGWALWLVVLLLAAPLNSVNSVLGSVAGPCPPLQKGALRARSAERKTEEEKLEKLTEKKRERERRKESRASARAIDEAISGKSS